MRLFKKVVDEREEKEMMGVEHVMFWLVFWALLISIFVQLLGMKATFRQVSGEWTVFMLMAVGTTIGEVRGGHFDYTSRPGWKAYLLYSVAAALAVMLLTYVRRSVAGYDTTFSDGFLLILIFGMFSGVVTFACLSAAGRIVKCRRKKLEKQFDEEK